jgi:CMP-N-acetylneuraminic acid synthetase
LKRHAHANSIQTISTFPHNYHAYNQRIIEDGAVKFRFVEERARCYNKQSKPEFFVFGNLVVTRSQALHQMGEVFAQPSLPYKIPYRYALDVDGPEDLTLAEWSIRENRVVLPEMEA